MFVLNVVVFVLLLVGTVARFVMFRGVFGALLRHPVSSMFWGALSMGLTTIVVSANLLVKRQLEREAREARRPQRV